MSRFADFDAAVWRPAVVAGLTPPPRLSLSEWADGNFRLSAESAAAPGPWKCLPYQRGIMDAITDPSVTHVSLMKSARVGYTLMVSAAVGYYIAHAPCNILLVQPTLDDARGFSKETIAPMLRDVPALSAIMFEEGEEVGDSGNTILHKHFPGGVLSLVGANSGAGFRRTSRKTVIFDEVDAYPPSAGSDGDPIKLGTKRSEFYWDRKILAGSTPLIAGRSRIEALFHEGDQRRFYVPCPQCGHMAPLVFRPPAGEEGGVDGHRMRWPKDEPEKAFFECQANGCVIEHHEKRAMVERGEWRAAREFSGHASFHIWAAYSYSPNASWGQLALEFVAAAHGGHEQLRVYVNTVLGEVWREKGDAPEWERLYQRRERYAIGSVPEGVLFLTGGIDVQKDRVVYEIVGWGEGKQSWSIDSGVIPFDTSNEGEWAKADELLARTYRTATGATMAVRMMAVDSGAFTQFVYAWARRHSGRVIATKGQRTARVILGAPTPVDVTIRGKRIARGCKVWAVGVDIAKAELYGWLRLPDATSPGFCHFPEHGEDYFKQLTAEQLVTSTDRRGFTATEWQVIPGRENHGLDARVYARAAAALVGLDRMAPKPLPAASTPTVAAPAPPVRPAAAAPPARPAKQAAPKRPGAWLGGSDSRFGGRSGWLSKKR